MIERVRLQMRVITRRQALREGLVGTAALTLARCGAGDEPEVPAHSGSTLRSTWADPVGDGQLRVAAGEQLLDRLELGPPAASIGVLATLAHLTDAHVLDASSPARVTFLDRLGPPFQSTFRPQEALTAQVLSGAVGAVRALDPQVVIQGGDLIDNDQTNELQQALAILRGGRVRPGSGPNGYVGVQSAANGDPFYYRPDVDAPRYPGLLAAAVAPFSSPALETPWHAVLGDHDALVAGEIVPTTLTRSLAVGDRALWDLPSGLQLPAGARRTVTLSPDGPPDPGLVDVLLRRALSGPTVQVPADPGRQELSIEEVVARLGAASAAGLSGAGATPSASGPRLDYAFDVGRRLRVIVLDLVRRAGGSGGLVATDQPHWLQRQLMGAGQRWVVVVSHQPLTTSSGGEALLERLDRWPRVIAILSGHTHRNRIVARTTPAGGYWIISTASLIDYPQQARALRLLATAGGGVAIQTWMLDHVFPGQLGRTARQLSFLDAQGGRPEHLAGAHQDRNVTLYRRGVA